MTQIMMLMLSIVFTGCATLMQTGESSEPPKITERAISGEPVQMRVLASDQKRIKEKLELAEKQAENGTLVGPNSAVTSLRFELIGHYRFLLGHGSQAPCPGCMKTPQWKQAKDEYPGLAQRVAKLEAEILACTYGLQDKQGNIVEPSVQWSWKEWETKSTSAKHGTARCWKKDDLNSYEF